MNGRLSGKVALVTGGARGIGREIALTLAAEGATVAVNFLTSAAEAQEVVETIKARGGMADRYRGDVSDFASVQELADAIARDFGGIEIVVNNAGLAVHQKFLDTEEADWRSQIDTCLYGVIHTARALAPHLQKNGQGRILSIVGDSARSGEAGYTISAAARGGVIAFTKSLAREWGSFGVTANVLSLGLVETDLTRDFLATHGEKISKLYPLRRTGQPQDIAPMAALLASADGAWITGQVISINGGFIMA